MSTTSSSTRRPSGRHAFAALLALVLAGVWAITTAGTASATDSNDPAFWETLPGEQCTKYDISAEDGGYTVPAENDGFDWSKLIIKKGSGDSQGEENTVILNPVAGETYYHASGSGYSHIILCQVPEETITPSEDISETPTKKPTKKPTVLPTEHIVQPGPHKTPPTVLGTEAVVPTVVNAGLSGEDSGNGALPFVLAVIAAGALAAAGSLLIPRRRHES